MTLCFLVGGLIAPQTAGAVPINSETLQIWKELLEKDALRAPLSLPLEKWRARLEKFQKSRSLQETFLATYCWTPPEEASPREFIRVVIENQGSCTCVFSCMGIDPKDVHAHWLKHYLRPQHRDLMAAVMTAQWQAFLTRPHYNPGGFNPLVVPGVGGGRLPRPSHFSSPETLEAFKRHPAFKRLAEACLESMYRWDESDPRSEALTLTGGTSILSPIDLVAEASGYSLFMMKVTQGSFSGQTYHIYRNRDTLGAPPLYGLYDSQAKHMDVLVPLTEGLKRRLRQACGESFPAPPLAGLGRTISGPLPGRPAALGNEEGVCSKKELQPTVGACGSLPLPAPMGEGLRPVLRSLSLLPLTEWPHTGSPKEPSLQWWSKGAFS